MGTIIFDPVTLTLEFDPFFENYNFCIVSARALIFQKSILSVGTIIFYPVTLTFEFDLLFKNFNLANNFKLWVLELGYLDEYSLL